MSNLIDYIIIIDIIIRKLKFYVRLIVCVMVCEFFIMLKIIIILGKKIYVNLVVWW